MTETYTRVPLSTSKFEGLMCRYPLHKDGNKTLYWTMEHHATDSLGGYEVQIGRESTVFFQLKEAVEFFNSGGKKK